MCAVLLAHDVTMACDTSYHHLVLVPCTHSAVLVYSTFAAKCMAWLQLNYCQRMGVLMGVLMGRAHCLSHDSGQMPQPVPNPKLVGLHHT